LETPNKIFLFLFLFFLKLLIIPVIVIEGAISRGKSASGPTHYTAAARAIVSSIAGSVAVNLKELET
jgi:hypothetical protein